MVNKLLHTHEMMVLSNHLYEYKKGVRHLVLHTIPKDLEGVATKRLRNQGIDFVVQEVSHKKINLYFGKPECIKAIKLIASRPLNELTPEEDFILGAMLGYDLCAQCTRYCNMKERS